MEEFLFIRKLNRKYCQLGAAGLVKGRGSLQKELDGNSTKVHLLSNKLRKTAAFFSYPALLLHEGVGEDLGEKGAVQKGYLFSNSCFSRNAPLQTS